MTWTTTVIDIQPTVKIRTFAKRAAAQVQGKTHAMVRTTKELKRYCEFPEKLSFHYEDSSKVNRSRAGLVC
jgi:hypothetical protein